MTFAFHRANATLRPDPTSLGSQPVMRYSLAPVGATVAP